ncbi:MAG: homoserine kinase [Bacteroidota bacterium]
MALYSQLNEQDIQTILQSYSVGNLQRWRLLHGGAENTNHLIETNKGTFILTLCERKSIKETQALAHLLEHFDNHQFSTSKIFKNRKGQLQSSFQNKPVLLKSFLPGKVLLTPPRKVIHQIGAQLGQLHQVPVPAYLPKQFSYGQQTFTSLYASDTNHPFPLWLRKKRALIVQKSASNLTKVLIHGDVFTSNVIVAPDGKPTVMDFEEACHYYRVFDLGMAIVGLCSSEGKVDLDKMNALIKGYETVNPLLPKEKQQLPLFIIYAATATAFWRFRQFNLLVPNEERKEDYKEMQTIADSIKLETSDWWPTKSIYESN